MGCNNSKFIKSLLSSGSSDTADDTHQIRNTSSPTNPDTNTSIPTSNNTPREIINNIAEQQEEIIPPGENITDNEMENSTNSIPLNSNDDENISNEQEQNISNDDDDDDDEQDTSNDQEGNTIYNNISDNDDENASNNQEENDTTENADSSSSSSLERYRNMLANRENIPQLVEGIMTGNVKEQQICTTHIRRLVSIEQNPPIQEVIDTGVVPKFIEFLQRDDDNDLLYEALWVLTNITSGTSDQTRFVVDVGAIPTLVHLLSHQNEDVCEQAVWTIGNIAGDNYVLRDMVLNADAMSSLLDVLNTTTKRLTMRREATWALSNLCRGKPQFEQVKDALTVLPQLISADDEDGEVIADSLWALSYLTDEPCEDEAMQAVIDADVCSRLVQLLMNPDLEYVEDRIRAPALRTAGNIIMSSNSSHVQHIMDCDDLFQALTLTLKSPTRSIRNDTCSVLNNMMAGDSSTNRIQDVIEANIIPSMIEMIKGDESVDSRKVVTSAFYNAITGGSLEQIKYLVNKGVIETLCDSLRVDDDATLNTTLQCLSRLLTLNSLDLPTSSLICTANAWKTIEDLKSADDTDDERRHECEVFLASLPDTIVHDTVKTGIEWDGGLRMLVMVNIDSLAMEEEESGLLPYMLALERCSQFEGDYTRLLNSLNNAYQLLCLKPDILNGYCITT